MKTMEERKGRESAYHTHQRHRKIRYKSVLGFIAGIQQQGC